MYKASGVDVEERDPDEAEEGASHEAVHVGLAENYQNQNHEFLGVLRG